MLTKEEIEKIASLARIALSEKEKQRLVSELSSVIDYFQKLQQVDTTGVDLNLTETETTNATRADKKIRGENQQKVLANAPMREENFIKVKSVL